MARGYLGKISAVVAINTGGVKPSLNSSAKDIQSWGRTVQSRLSSTSEAAKRAVDGIFTPLQKLQAAVNAANKNPLKLGVPNVRAYLDLAKAIDQIGKPLGNAQKQFSSLSQGVQAELLPAFRGAQKQATQLFDAISSGAKVSDRDFSNTEARINRVTQAIARANEASQAVRGLAGGQELRFQNPEFLRSTSRAAQLQQQAAALAPDAIAGRGIVALVGQQRQAADEAERLRAILERTVVTRNGDQEAARRAYTQQIAFLDQVNDRLERQIQLERQASEVNANVGAATQLRSTQDPTGRSIQQRLRDIRDAEISSNVGAFSRRATDVRQYIALLEEARRRTESLADAQRRAEAASRFLQVDQRESNLIANEGQAQNVREYIALLESARQRTEALADAQLRAQAASRLLQVDQRESNLIASEGQSQDIRAYLNLLEQARQRTEALADAQARAQAASRFLQVDQRESNLIANEGQAQDIRAYIALLEEARRRTDDLAEAQLRAQAASRFLQVDQRESALISNEGQAQDIRAYLALLDEARRRTDALSDAQLRAQAASRFLQVDQRESDLIASQGQSQDIADYLIQLEEARRRTEALADAQRRAEAASRFLSVDQVGSDILSSQGEQSPLAGNRDPRTRVLNTLNQDIGDLRNRTRGIGDTLAGDVGPIVDNLTTRFQNLARAGIGFTAEQARGLAREVANVNAALNSRQEIAQRFGESFGGAGRLGLSLGVDERSLRSIGKQIEFVQGRLSALAQEARGPVITALDALRARAQQLFEGGALDTEEGRAELRALQAEIVRTLSAAGGGSEAQVRAGLQRAGDIGRGGFDRFSLAIQQAAFAIDDFFSVTGGLDQRIRAVGNNVSQLGFVLGGWQGLVAGIAASISAQLVVGLVKWYNAGVSSESQTKAINDALSQQKTLVDQLAQSFESLSDSLVQRAFSPATREAQSFAKSLREIAKQQKELQVARFTLLDPTAFQQNAQASEFQRRIQGTTDAGQTLALLRARARAEAAARAAAVGAAGRQGTFDDAVNAIGARPANRAEAANQIFGNIVDALGSIFTGPNPAASANRIRGTNTVEARQRFEAARGNRQEEIRVVEQRLNELQDLAQQGTDSLYGFFSGQSAASAAASREFARLTTVLATLNSQLESDNALISFLKRLNQATADIATAQEQAAEAIRAGIPGSFALASALDRLDSEIQASADAIKEAEKRLRDRGAAATVDDRQQRDDAVQRETASIARNRAARERVIARAAEVDRRRIVDPQSTLDAIRSRAEANLGESGLQSGSLARRLRELDARRREVEARLQREGGAANPFAARRADRELAAINQQAAAIEASTIALKKFTEYLNRAAQESQSNLEAARQREEQVRRDDLGRSTPRSRGARQRAEADLRRQEELNNRVQDEVAKARARLEEQAQDPANPLSGTFARAREIDQLLAAGGLSAAEQARLIEERRRLQDRIDRAINQEQSVIDARDASTREAERQQSEQRGRDLMLRPGQQAALELDRQIADIVEGAAGRRRRDPLGLNAARINQDEQDAIRRVREEAFRQQAPAIFGLADSVANALLQGPSRAALQPTDVSTVEGSRELTRLLRGDDAAKDQANLVELQKEANKLLDMIARNPAQIAN